MMTDMTGLSVWFNVGKPTFYFDIKNTTHQEK